MKCIHKMTPSILLVAIFLYILAITNAANILIMLPLPFYSHTNNYMPIFKELAIRGHNVTLVSPYPQKEKVKNFNEIVVPDVTNITGFGEQGNIFDTDNIWSDLIGLWKFAEFISELGLKLKQVQNIIKSEDTKFDLIMLETLFIQESYVAFGHRFNAPVINLMPTFLFPHGAHLTGNDFPIAYVPNRKLPYSDRMDFIQRSWNFFYYIWDVYIGQLYYLKQQETLMKKYFKYPGSENLPPLTDMLRNTSLTLVDNTFPMSYPTPFQKNVVEIGGINIKKYEKLDKDLEIFLDNAKDGFVYFSLGSQVRASNLKFEIQSAFINGLSKLNRKVLIKYEDGNQFENKTGPNILMKSWFPQPSILAHPNCKLFITHGGLHSLMEAVHNAVPMIALPIFADQMFNAKFLETERLAIILNYREITEEIFINAINTVFSDKSYQDRINQRSAIFRDTPINTLDNAIYWIEYVIRHRGAPHLRPAVLDLYWYQLLMLDVILFYTLIIILLISIIKFIYRLIVTIILIIIKLIFNNKKSNTKVIKKTE